MMVLLMFVRSASAQLPGKIAVIDSAKAFEQSAEGEKALAQFQDRGALIKSSLDKKEDAIRALMSKLNVGRLTMTQEAMDAFQSEINRQTTERKRMEEDMGRDMAQFRDGLLNKIRAEMVAIVVALRKERGHVLFLDVQGSGIVDFDPALDVTAELIRRYDSSKTASPPEKKTPR